MKIPWKCKTNHFIKVLPFAIGVVGGGGGVDGGGASSAVDA